MRIFSASFGPDVINHTVIFSIQKSARHTLKHVIILFINPKILIDELLRLLPKMFGNPLNICKSKKRSGCFATIGTFQAICFFKFLIVQFLHDIINILRRFLFKLIEILLVFVMLIFGQFWKIFNYLFQLRLFADKVTLSSLSF